MCSSGASTPQRLRELFDEATHGEFSQIPDVLEAIQNEANEIIVNLEEQLEAAQRVIDAAQLVSTIEATGTWPDFQPLADALDAYWASFPASHPQLEDNADPMWESGDEYPATRD